MPNKIGGPRKHVILSKPQNDAMNRLSTKTGLTVSEHIRRAVDLYLARAAERMTQRPR